MNELKKKKFEVFRAGGAKISDIAKELGVSARTLYRWQCMNIDNIHTETQRQRENFIKNYDDEGRRDALKISLKAIDLALNAKKDNFEAMHVNDLLVLKLKYINALEQMEKIF